MSTTEKHNQTASGGDRGAPPSDAWRPTDPGDQLDGYVVDVDTAWSKFRASRNPENPDAGWYPLLTVRLEDGSERKVHCFRTVLYNEIMRKQPIAGERVTITFIGEGPARDGMNGAHIYRVNVHGRAGTANAYQGMLPASGPSGNTPQATLEQAPVDGDDDDLPF